MKRARLLISLLMLMALGSLKAQVVISSVNTPYKQDFDSLDNNYGDTSAVMPHGWYFSKPKVYSKTYKVDNGNSTAGNVYSYGATSGTDRALGTLGSGTTAPVIGAGFKNGTGTAITSVKFKFNVEQWRSAAKGRFDTSKCEISFSAKGIDDNTTLWVPVSQLNLTSVDTAATSGALNGNSSTNQKTISYTVTGIYISNGATVWVRWTDANITGSDDGLAIDDFELTANPSVTATPSVSFTSKTLSIAENGDSVQVSIAIKDANSSATSVDVAVDKSSTASATTDYTYTGKTYTFPASSSSNISFWIPIKDDKTPEGNETIVLKLRKPTNSATLGDSALTITITDNDSVDYHYKIRDVKVLDSLGAPDSAGKKAILTGIVSSASFGSGSDFYMYDSTGSIHVFSSKTYGYTAKPGDSISVYGTIGFFRGVTEIDLGSTSTDTMMVMSSGNKVASPAVVTKLNESTESKLIKIENVRLVDASKWTTGSGSGGFTVQATNGKDTFDVRIDKDINLYNMAAPKGKFDVTGFGSQFDASSPYFSGYQLLASSMFEARMYKISELRKNDANGVPVLKDSIVIIKGIVESPTFTPGGFEFFMYDSTGGVEIFSTAAKFGYTPAIGDSIQVEGKVSFFKGLTEVTFNTPGKDTIFTISSGNTVHKARAVSTLNESTEGSLVKMIRVKLVNPAQWNATGSGFNADVTNGTDTIQIRIDKDIDLFNMPAPKGLFIVTGIGGQFDNTSPYFSGYQLMVRSSNDIFHIPPVKLYSVAQLEVNDSTGKPRLMDSLVRLKGIVSSGSTNFNKNGLQIAFYDSTGGMTIFFNNKAFGYTPAAGDSIDVTGQAGFFRGLTEIVQSGLYENDTLMQLNAGNTVKSPAIVSKLSENTESELVTLENLHWVDTAQWTMGTGTGGFTARAFKGTDTFDIRIDQDVDLYNMPLPFKGAFDVTGIGSQFDATSPYTSGYQLMPRDKNDFKANTGIEDNNPLAAMLRLYPNPANDILNVKIDGRMDKIVITDMAGRALMNIQTASGTQLVDISSLKAGIYFIQVSQGENTVTKKFFKN